MTGTVEAQTPKARLLHGPYQWYVRYVLCIGCAMVRRLLLGVVDVCRVPIPARKRLPLLLKYENFPAKSKQACSTKQRFFQICCNQSNPLITLITNTTAMRIYQGDGIFPDYGYGYPGYPNEIRTIKSDNLGQRYSSGSPVIREDYV